MSRNRKNVPVKKSPAQQSPHIERTSNRLKVTLDDMDVIGPLTDTQANFMEDYSRDDLSAYMLIGSAGTGKSMLSLYCALEEVLDPSTVYEKVVIVRSPVALREIGHLPGTEDDKMMVYETPYIDICAKLFSKKEKAYERLKEQGKIEFSPTSFIRGNSFENAIIFYDEIQNGNYHELSSVATRAGENTKMIFCGDGVQCDLTKRGDISGFDKFVGVVKNTQMAGIYEFTRDDIVRSEWVKRFIIAGDDWDIGIRR